MDDDFQLLEYILTQETASLDDCPHSEHAVDKGMYVCLACGFSERISDGQTYTSHKMYKRASKNTNIIQILESKGFDSYVAVTANRIFNIVIDANSKRTGNRNSVMSACAFEAYKIHKHPKEYEFIYKKFDIEKRSALRGLKFVKLEIAKRKDLDLHSIILSPITPEDFIRAHMEELKAPEKATAEVLEICARIKGHKELAKSRPQSIASGAMLYWLEREGMTDAMKLIKARANLSQLTIHKKAKLVAQEITKNDVAHI